MQITQCAETYQADGIARRKEVDLAEEVKIRQMVGAKSLDEFKAMLVRRFGSLLRAWLTVFDKEGSGSVGKMQFINACRSIGYIGNLTSLWNELDDDGSQFVTIDEVDPESVKLLKDFQNKAEAKYGAMELFFRAYSKNEPKTTQATFGALPVKQLPTVTQASFAAGCREIGFDHPREVFRYFDLDGGGDLDLDELADNPLVAMMLDAPEPPDEKRAEREKKAKELAKARSEPALPPIMDSPPLRPWWIDFPPCAYGSPSAGRRAPLHHLRPPGID